jgi:hypothetical protein
MLDDMVHTVLGHRTAGLPPPVLEPEKGDSVIPVPPEILPDDIPEYEKMVPPEPLLPPTPRIGSPFPDKELSRYVFVEENMPVFSVEYGVPVGFEPLCAPVDFRHPTWGADGEKTLSDLYVPPLLDQHVWPPLEIEESSEKFHRRKVLRRGIWETELYTKYGNMVPDLFDLTRQLQASLTLDDYSFEDIQNELKGSTEIVEEMLPIRPVRSLVKFFWDARPLPVADVSWTSSAWTSPARISSPSSSSASTRSRSSARRRGRLRAARKSFSRRRSASSARPARSTR